MSNQTSTAMLDRIRKILAKAEDPACTPAEAEALNAKAAELIAKYGVDRAMLAASDPSTDRIGSLVIYCRAPYAYDKAQLLGTIALALRCQAAIRKLWRDGGTVVLVHLFGFEADIERVDVLFTSLLVQAATGLAKARPPEPEWPFDEVAPAKVAAYRRSWMHGFRIAVGKRLREAEARAAAQHDQQATGGPSTALVLADRTRLVERALHDAYPTIKEGRPRQLSGKGTRDGWQAGLRADLGGTRLTDRAPAAIGG